MFPPISYQNYSTVTSPPLFYTVFTDLMLRLTISTFTISSRLYLTNKNRPRKPLSKDLVHSEAGVHFRQP